MPRLLFIAVLAGFCVLASGVRAANAPAPLPRYSFSVGRRLTYTLHSAFNLDSGGYESATSMQFTIVARNNDGSFRIIARMAQKYAPNVAGMPASHLQDAPESVNYGQYDLMPDGRMASEVGGSMNDAPAPFPPLPANAQEMTGTWTSESRPPGMTNVYRAAGPSVGSEWIFSNSVEGVFKTIYGISENQTYHFDLAKGLVTSMSSTNRQDYGFKGSGTSSLVFEHDETLFPEQFSPLAKDLSVLFAARTDAEKKLQSIEKSPDDSTRIAADITASLKASQASVGTAEIKAEFDQLISSMDQAVQYATQSAQQRAEVMGKPAFDFSAVDLDGHPHKLSDYRKKIVVLDFWYRGCGWCMRAMPQMKLVADDFKDKPVVVLGLNTDTDPNDAKFVVDALKLNYLTLRIDQDTVDHFNVRGFPCLVIVDNGVIREYDVGYSPKLRADLGKKIQSLLDSSVAQR